MAVILITVSILEVFLIASVDYYYHSSVKRILVKQAEISAAFFSNISPGRMWLRNQSGCCGDFPKIRRHRCKSLTFRDNCFRIMSTSRPSEA